MVSYPKDYVFSQALTDEWKADIASKTRKKLTEMLGVEVDNVMAEYVIVMVGNKKKMEQIAHELVDFIGDESAEQFVTWLSALLPTYETQALPKTESQPKKDENKGVIKSSSSEPQKKIVSLGTSRDTIRSLNPSKSDMDDVIARRAQRFGIVEKKPIAKKSPSHDEREESRKNGGKRRGNERGGSSRLAQRLGPPVNVAQAELDARDSVGPLKKRRDRHHDEDGERENRRNDREDAGRKGKKHKQSGAPLPPDDKDDVKGHGMGMAPPMGFHGGFIPPYGGPMFFPPPGYGPMNPYAMGFPPPPYGGRGYPRPPGLQNGPRGSRPFQNRKWVNPDVAKAEEAKATQESDEASSSTVNAPAFVPRNPYFSSQMRPRFQNKTWVRQDSARDDELNNSLPKTPPKELLESTE